MAFLNSYFLIALAAVAVPILIHLLTRDRVRKVAFSTLQFFQKISKKVLRRKKFREMLLLVMRAAACGLLALAFARPILRSDAADAVGMVKAGTARVIVVDQSASMRRPGLSEAAAKEAAAALSSLAEGADAAALVTFADAPRLDVPLGRDFGDLRTGLASLVPGHGGTDMAEAVRKADAVLRGAAATRKEIVLISDCQRAGWRSFKGDWKLAGDVRLTVRPVAPAAATADLAIVEADGPSSTALDGLPRTIAARIANFSAEDRKDLEVALTIGGRKVESQKVQIRKGESVPVRFRHVFTTPGDNPGTVTLAAADAVADDNVWYFNTRVIPRIRVAVISGTAAGSTPDDGAFFIEKALAPTTESPFAARRYPASAVSPADLADVQVAILADVKEVAPPVVAALKDLLARGGGILFLPGGAAQAEAFTRVFADIAPCKLRGMIRPGARGGDAPGATLTKIDFEHPIFEVFQHPHYGDLSMPRFRQYWEVGDSQLAHVLARFDDGKPAVLEREIGAGVSMMLTSAVDLKWNNFPLRAVFLPYLHQTVRYLAVRSEKRTGFPVGDALPLPQGWKLVDPAGKTREGTDTVAAAPGFYVARGPGAAETFQFAVNRDAAEADPATIAPDEVAAAVQAPDAAMSDDHASAADSSDLDRERDTQGLWWYVILAVAVLAVSELAVANKTLRH